MKPSPRRLRLELELQLWLLVRVPVRVLWLRLWLRLQGLALAACPLLCRLQWAQAASCLVVRCRQRRHLPLLLVKLWRWTQTVRRSKVTVLRCTLNEALVYLTPQPSTSLHTTWNLHNEAPTAPITATADSTQ